MRHSKESKPWDLKAAKANTLWKIDLRIFDTFEYFGGFFKSWSAISPKLVMGGVQESFSALQFSVSCIFSP